MPWTTVKRRKPIDLIPLLTMSPLAQGIRTPDALMAFHPILQVTPRQSPSRLLALADPVNSRVSVIFALSAKDGFSHRQAVSASPFASLTRGLCDGDDSTASHSALPECV